MFKNTIQLLYKQSSFLKPQLTNHILKHSPSAIQIKDLLNESEIYGDGSRLSSIVDKARNKILSQNKGYTREDFYTKSTAKLLADTRKRINNYNIDSNTAMLTGGSLMVLTGCVPLALLGTWLAMANKDDKIQIYKNEYNDILQNVENEMRGNYICLEKYELAIMEEMVVYDELK